MSMEVKVVPLTKIWDQEIRPLFAQTLIRKMWTKACLSAGWKLTTSPIHHDDALEEFQTRHSVELARLWNDCDEDDDLFAVEFDKVQDKYMGQYYPQPSHPFYYIPLHSCHHFSQLHLALARKWDPSGQWTVSGSWATRHETVVCKRTGRVFDPLLEPIGEALDGLRMSTEYHGHYMTLRSKK